MTNKITKEEANVIFREYSPYVFKVAFLLTKSETLADDITQETFITIFKKYHTYDNTKSLKPWIYQITVNTFRNMYRKQRWLKFVGLSLEAPSAEKIVEHSVVTDETSKELGFEISKLSPKSREVIVLYYFAELKLQEISAVLNIPVGTCKSRLHRAINDLRKQLTNQESYFHKGGTIYEKN